MSKPPNGMSTKKTIEPIYRRFGAKVSLLRTGRSGAFMTQGQLASKVGLTRTSLTNIEAGAQRILLDDVLKFAKALKVRPRKLMEGVW